MPVTNSSLVDGEPRVDCRWWSPGEGCGTGVSGGDGAIQVGKDKMRGASIAPIP
jgi:hypothetical protein